MGALATAEQAKTQAETGELGAKQKQSEAETRLAQQKADWYSQHGGMVPGVTPEEMGMVDWEAKNPGKGPSDFLKAKAAWAPLARFQIESNAGGGGAGGAAQIAQRFGMTPVAFDQQAEKYFTTGQLPPLGRGISGIALNRAIMNRAAELHPDASLAGNEAAFAANKSSLQKLQSNFDQVTAFENTAGKNLDQFLATAKNVIDSGSPVINRPLRSLSASAVGSANQAAFDAARTTALTEISKVLNSSNASGVLSDSARNEVSALIGRDATLNQIYQAAQILKTDMANRHQAYQEQLTDIQGRIRNSGSQGGTGGQSKAGSFGNHPFFQQFGGRSDQ